MPDEKEDPFITECRQIMRDGLATMFTELFRSMESHFSEERISTIINATMDGGAAAGASSAQDKGSGSPGARSVPIKCEPTSTVVASTGKVVKSNVCLPPNLRTGRETKPAQPPVKCEQQSVFKPSPAQRGPPRGEVNRLRPSLRVSHRVGRNRPAGPQSHENAMKTMVKNEWEHERDDQRARTLLFIATNSGVEYANNK